MNMVEIFYKQHSKLVTDDFKSFLDNETYIDLIFVCRNNRKVGAHQLVMSLLSRFLSDLFEQNHTDKIIYVYVPEIRAKILKCILQFVYAGNVTINRDELGELSDDLILLGMPLSVITSVDKAPLPTPGNQNISLPVATLPTSQTTPVKSVSNFNRSSIDSGSPISGIRSTSSNVFPPTSTANTDASSTMRCLNPSDQLIRNSYNKMYTMGAMQSLSIPPNTTTGVPGENEIYTRNAIQSLFIPPNTTTGVPGANEIYTRSAIQSLPIPPNTTTEFDPPPSSRQATQFSAELITSTTSPSCSTRSTPIKSPHNIISSNPRKFSESQRTPVKQKPKRKSLNSAKQQKTSNKQVINLAEESDDENDVITIS